eukprot:m51a1_g4557 hypothetical protein (182) ;mRNA; r:93899-97524
MMINIKYVKKLQWDDHHFICKFENLLVFEYNHPWNKLVKEHEDPIELPKAISYLIQPFKEFKNYIGDCIQATNRFETWYESARRSSTYFKRSTTIREMQPVRRVPLCENVRTLLTSPETTSRERTSKEAHDALQVVAQLRASKRLYEVKLMNLFPTATMVMALEQRFSPDPTPTTTAIKSI